MTQHSISVLRKQLRSTVLSLSLVAGIAGTAEAAEQPVSRTIGFVVTSWFTAKYNTPHWDECPEGAVIGNDELWMLSLPQAERIRQTKAGTIQPVDGERKALAVVRGPNGEDVCWNPTVVQDPPLRTIKGKFSFGFNLDDDTEGKGTAKSCAHDNFESPDGEPGIDNQIYRILGCILGWRNGMYMEGHPNGERRDSGKGTILIEVRNVDDTRNDDDVEVAFYGSLDPFPKDAAGNLLPHASFRISGTPHYGSVAKGKITDGTLTIDPIDARLPLWGNNYTGDMDFRDMRLRLEIAEDGSSATGMIGGYYDLDKWWDYIRKIEFLLVAGQWNCPAMYEAAHRLADGYPDPVTGKCTALSTALTIEAIPAFIVHPKETNRPGIVQGPTAPDGRTLAQAE